MTAAHAQKRYPGGDPAVALEVVFVAREGDDDVRACLPVQLLYPVLGLLERILRQKRSSERAR